jgi:hypothetical protein
MTMDSCRFNRLVIIKDRRRAGSVHNTGSVREAANCLIGGSWPRPWGPVLRA